MALGRSLSAAAVFATACSAAYADRPAQQAIASPHIALDIAPARLRAPYDVQIMRSNGAPLPTFAYRDRFYVQGHANERYLIRITNPTDHRIEAVVSVDGLDVIDGENGDLGKRGYVVPAYGETRIEGFRTSQADVATFRFSTVSGSYAGQKGKARNVGVIAVALFEELAPAPEQIIIGAPRRPEPRPYDDRYDLDQGAARERNTPADRPATTASAGAPRALKRSADAASAVRPPPPAPVPGRYTPPSGADTDDDSDEQMVSPPGYPRHPGDHERLGLGTEFGEQRTAAASYTRFVRAPGRPIAIAELRYNDAAGLMALGIPVQPRPDAGELMVRETADPFPGDRYAQPPR